MADAGRSARDGLLGTRTVAVTLLALLVALFATAPAAHAVDRQDAAKKALAALGTDSHDDAVIVFGLRSTLAPGTRITEAGPAGAAVAARPARNAFERARNRRIRKSGATFRRSGDVMRSSRGERSWLFFEDQGPHQAFEHPGRVVLVGARTGTVRISARTTWVPLVAGRVPPFFRSAKGYESKAYRVFNRLWSTPGARHRAQSRQAPAGEARQQVADALAAEKSCALRLSDTLGDFFDFGRVDQTRARLGQFFESLENLNAGFVSRRYTTKAGDTPVAAAQDLIDRAGCKDLFLYAAGAGTRTGEGGIVIGLRPARGGRVEWHVLTAGQLEGLVEANRDVTFKFLFDAPYTSRLNRSLIDEPNTLLLIASGGPNEASFTYLPEILGPDGVQTPSNNPDQLLEFTNAILAGLEGYVRNPQEYDAWLAGRSLGGPSMMAWMMARALVLSPAWMFAAPIDTLKIPVMPKPGGDPTPPVPPPPVNHTPVPTTPAQPTREDTPKAFTLTANDPDGDPLTFTVTDQPDHGTLTGTAPNLVYTPAQDFNGNDAFRYRVADNRGASAEQTVQLPVTEDNDAATVVASAGGIPPEFTEDGSAVAVDDQLTITDPDSTQLESATVRVLTGFKAGDDVLAFDASTLPAGVTDDYDANDGILTLTGPATLTQYRDMLRSVTFDSTSQDPGTARTIEFRAEDGDEAGVPATRDLTVVPVNDAPVLDTTDDALAYDEGDGATAVDSGIALSDVDSTHLTGATVQITSNFASAEDDLTFTSTPTITGSYNDTTGTLTLSGTDTLAAYQAALRGVRYQNTSDNPSTSTRTVSFRVTEGAAANNVSDVATRNVTVARVNDAPVAVGGGTLAYTENEPAKQITSTLALSDVDDTDLELGRVSITANHEAGDDLSWTDNDAGDGITLGSDNDTTDVLTLTGTGTVAQYQAALRAVQYASSHDNPATGKTISFVAGDGTAESAPADVPVTVTRVNDAPTLDTTDSALTYEEGDGETAVDTGVTLTDPDSTQITGATVQITSNFVQAQDDLTFASSATITGSYNDATGTMTLSGVDTLANYQAALRAVKYQNTSDNPSTTTRTVSFRVDDGGAVANLSNVATRDVTVGPANDAPVVTTSGGSTSYGEGDSATVVDSAVTLTDVDDANIEGAVVRVSQNFESGDVLAFANTANITGNYSAGTLTLSGTDTVANYQSALRSITYRHTGDNPQTGKVIEFVANDGSEDSNAATKSINVTGVNDGPTLTTTASSLTYGEGDGEVAVDPGVTVDDPENNTISAATVQITANHTQAEDELTFTDAGGITKSYDDASGTLTLSGTASESAYQAALRGVRYVNSSENPSTATRTMTFRVTDTGSPAEQSNAATRDVTVGRVNDAPTVTTSNGTTTYVEGGSPSVVDNQLTVLDADDTNLEGATVRISSLESGDTLTFVNTANITGNYSAGTMTLSGTDTVANYQAALRSITFSTTNDDPATSKAVEFEVNDGDLDSNAPAKTLSVTRTNDGPTIDTTDAALTYAEGDGSDPIDGGLTVTDPDSTQIQGATVQITSNHTGAEDLLEFTNTASISHSYNAANGTLTLTGAASLADYQAALRAVRYHNTSDNPNTDTRTISFQATDADGAAGNTATRDVTISRVNDAPAVTTSAGDTSYSEGASATPVDDGVNVVDVDDTNLESATVRISSGFQSGDTLTVTDTANLVESYDAGTGILTLTGTDTKANYHAVLRSIGFATTHDAPVASKTVEFKVNDGALDSNAATKGLAITASNDAPTVNTSAGTAAFTEDDSGPVLVDSALTVSDPDSANLSGATVSITGGFDDGEDFLNSAGGPDIDANYNPTTGVLTLTGDDTVANYQAVLRAVTYDNTDSVGPSTTTRTISFQVTDSSNAASNTATRDVSVTQTNDPPELTTTNGSTPYTEDASAVAIDDGIMVSDAEDTDLDSGRVRITSGFQTGDAIAFTPTANITGSYDSAAGVLTLSTLVGEASLAEWQTALRSVTFSSTNQTPVTSKTVEFEVNDGDSDSNAPTKEIAVTPVNDAPTVTAGGTLAYTENDPATAVHSGLTVAENEGDQLSGGSASITSNYAAGQDVLAWTDNNLADNITRDGVNSTSQTIVLTGVDDAADYQAALRAVTYQNGSENPTTSNRTVTFSATDQPGLTASATRTIAVLAVDDPPVGVNDSAQLLEDAAATSIPVLTNDTDVDLGPKTISSATDPANGTVVLTGGSAGAHTGLTYQPDPNYCNDPPGTSPDTFQYTLNGGSTAMVSMTVTCVNDAPVADDETFNGNDSAHGNTSMVVNDPDDGAPSLTTPKSTVNTASSTTGDILTGDSDVDGPGPLTVTPGTFATKNPSTNVNDGGSVTLESDGDFIFQPPTGCTASSSAFDYTVEDSGSPEMTDTGRVTIAIAGCVWYVDNQSDPATDVGTSTRPFNTLAEAEAASGANHTVFVDDGDDTSTGYDAGGYQMNSGERLIGEHEGLTVDQDHGTANSNFDADTLRAASVGAHPTLVANGADVIDLDDGNEIRGVTLDPAGAGGGIFGGSGDTGGGTFDDLIVIDNGTAATQPALELNATTGTFNITSFAMSNKAHGVLLQNAGTVDFGGDTSQISLTTAGGPALTATTTNMGSSHIDDIVVTGSGNGAVDLDGTTGSTALGDGIGTDLNLTTTSGTEPALDLNNAGTITIDDAGTEQVNATGGPAIDVTGTSNPTLDFNDVRSTNSSTAGGSGDGINLDGLGAGTFESTTGEISGAAGIAVDVHGGSGDVTFPGPINNGEGRTADVTGRSGGTVTLSGPITETGDSDATAGEDGGVTIGLSSANSGGATTINHATTKIFNTGEDHAIAMSQSAGHTLTLGGGNLDIDTTTGNGLDAQASGTLVVAGDGNTIDTGSGRALNVSTTAIGNDHLTFRRISSNGAVNGIRLNATSNSSGGLFVTGSGSGTCPTADLTTPSPTNATCTGGVISGSTGDGISLNNVPGPVELTRVGITNGQADGFDAVSVGGIEVNHSAIVGNGNGTAEDGVDWTNVTGVSSIHSSDVLNSRAFNARVANTTGTAHLTVQNSDFQNATEEDGLQLITDGTATFRSNVTNNDFKDNLGDGIQYGSVAASPSAVTDATITNNRLEGRPASTIDGGIVFSGDGSVRGTITGNTIKNVSVGALIVNPFGTAAGTVFDTTVTGNTIGTAGVQQSGSSDGDGMQLKSPSKGTSRTVMSNNNIRGWQGVGMRLRASETTNGAASHLTAQGNTIGDHESGAASAAIWLQSGSGSADVVNLCANVGGAGGLANTFVGGPVNSPGGIADFVLDLRFANSTLRLPNYAGPPQSYFLGRNTGFSNFAQDGIQTPQNEADGACDQPSAPAAPTAPTPTA